MNLTFTTTAEQMILDGTAPITHGDDGKHFINFDSFEVTCKAGNCRVMFNFGNKPIAYFEVSNVRFDGGDTLSVCSLEMRSVMRLDAA